MPVRQFITVVSLAYAAGFGTFSHAAVNTQVDLSSWNSSASIDHDFKANYYLYTATRNFTLTPIAIETEEGSIPNTKNIRLDFEKGDALIVEETTKDKNGRLLVRFGIDGNDDEPTSFWAYALDVRSEDLKPTVATLAELMNLDESGLEGPEDDYVETEVAAKGGGHAKKRKRASNYCTLHPRSKGCCKSGVNYRLIAMGLIKTRVGGVSATSMAGGLGARGWREVGCKARFNSPSRGMTCTFKGGANGHTEVFTGKCWDYGAKCGAAMTWEARRCFSCRIPGYSSRFKK